MPRIGGNPRAEAPMQLPFVGEPANDDSGNIQVDLGDNSVPLSTFGMSDGQFQEISQQGQPPIGSITEEMHGENLAELLDESFLNELGQKLVQKIEADITERAPWRARFERGLEMMGLIESDIDDGAFPGASNVVHPLLVEAITQFWARGMNELFPAEGPAKGKVIGDQRKDRLDRAQRVAEYMNYEMTVEDEGYTSETSRLMWSLPLHGSSYRKTYRDPVLDRNIGVYVPADDLIVPAEATSLKTAERFTHRMRKSPNELRQLRLCGYYRDVELSAPQQGEEDEALDLRNEAMDITPDGEPDDVQHEIFETCINLDIPGFEHLDEETGEPTGLEIPFIVTTERTSRRVLAIYAGWKKGDPKFRRKVYITKYSFVPGFGFYDFGFLHLIGGLQAAATGALRVLLDSAATASLSGGFVSKNVSLKGETLVVSPGEWKTVDATSEDLQKAFFPIPVKEPSPALFQLLGMLVDGAQRFTATTEIQTGGGNGKDVAVGTVSRLIEQGERVMSTVHRMAHSSLKEELTLRFELCTEYAPTDGYPYDVSGAERTVYAEDFAPGVGVVPVSDPNIFSSAQRLAISQAVYETSMANPDVVPRKKAIRRLYESMRVPDIDDLLPDDPEPMPYDPAGEIQAMLLGKSVLVLPEQPHVEHLKVLWAFASNPQFGANEQVQAQVGPAMIACIGQHLAYAWTTHVRALGAPAGYMDPKSGEVQPPQIPPEQLAQMIAQLAPQLAQVPGMPAIEGEDKGDDGKIEIERAKLDLKREEGGMKMQLEREKHQLQQEIAAQKAQFEADAMQQKIMHEKQLAELKQQIAMFEAQTQSQVTQVKAEQEIEAGNRQAAMQEQEMARESEMAQQRANMEQDTMQRDGAMREAEASQEMQLKDRKAQSDSLRGWISGSRGGGQ